MLTALAACLWPPHGWECLYLQGEVETSHPGLTKARLRPCCLQRLNAKSRRLLSERGDVCGEEGGPSLQETEAAGSSARSQAGQARRGPGGHGAPADKCTAAGRAWTAMHGPYIQASEKTRSWSRLRADAGPAQRQAGEGAPLVGSTLAPGWCAFILLLPQPLDLGSRRRVLGLLVFQRNVYNLISQMIPI